MEDITYPTQTYKAEDEGVVDPFCDPNHPVKITIEDVMKAQATIQSGVIKTPCEISHMSEVTGMKLYLKKDFLQFTGSFKERGARNTLINLNDRDRKLGVISASLGNHALGLSYHGKCLGIPVTVVMPVVAPIMKVSQCRKFNARVIVQGNDMKEAKTIALNLAKAEGLTYINGYDHPHVMAGQGVIGMEILEQIPDVEAVLVPIGGGGLIAGVAVAIKSLAPHVKIYGIESTNCASFAKAAECKKPTFVKIESTLADGLAVSLVGVNAFETAHTLIDKLVAVKEEWIARAILRFVEYEKCIVEGAGAIGLAAILAGHVNELKGKKVVLHMSGGNIDTTILGRCLERGLAADGRLIKILVTVSDRPGGIGELCRLLGSIRVSIKDILHERAWMASDVFTVQVTVVCETSDLDHSQQVRELLGKHYKKVEFVNFPTS